MNTTTKRLPVRTATTGWSPASARASPTTSVLDVTVVRLLTVLGAIFSFGTVAVAYVVAWILMPEA